MLHRLKLRGTDSRSETIWLTIYADMVTNLMLVFLALFGLTIMGDDSIAKAVQSMKLEDISQITENPTAQFEDIAPALQFELQNVPDIRFSEGKNVVRIEFGEKILFGSGRAVLKPESAEVLRSVGRVLSVVPYTIVVEGHTDDIPLKGGGPFRNNWELSLGRSMSVVRFMSGESLLPVGQMAAAAYGTYRPRAPNSSAAGRRLNRRVEIAIFRDFEYRHGQ